MQNFFLVLHPSANSKADRKLGEKAQDVNGWRQIEKSPVRLDLLIVSAYIDNWHPSLTDLARMFHDQVCPHIVRSFGSKTTTADYWVAKIHTHC